MVPSQTSIDLGLGNDDDHPRRFLVLPSNFTNDGASAKQSERQVLAYGGDDGTITFLPVDMESPIITNNIVGKAIRRYDDGAVRAVAMSNDGKRVAVGLDDGTTKIYHYDDYDSKKSPHPFAAAAANDEQKREDDDALFSQDLALCEDEEDEGKSFAGPQFEAPIRELQFHPNQDKGYFLAIATEASLCLVNVTSTSTLSQRYLQMEAEKHHDYCGIRAISFAPLNGRWLASLAMDGRLCVWGTSMESDPSTWRLLHRESSTCIPKKDVGEIHGADVSDRSCRPIWLNFSIGSDRESAQAGANEYYLGTPGKVHLVLRRVVPSEKDDSISVLPSSADLNNVDSPASRDGNVSENKEEGGHVESIVSIAQVGNMSSVLSSGRDGRIVLWDIDNGNAVKPKQLGHFESIPTDLMVGQRVVFAACADGRCRILSLPKSHVPRKDSDEDDSSLLATNGSHLRSKRKSDDPRRNQKYAKRGKEEGDDDDDDVNFADDDDSQGNEDASNSRVRFVDDEAAEEEDDDGGEIEKDLQLPSITRDESSKDILDQPDADDDISEELDLSRFRNMDRMAQLPAVSEQPAFSPSSTPLDLSRRFLCWNHMGAVTLLRGGDILNDRNTVDITFTDSGVRRPISFTDNQDFIVGSIGDDGGIFASDLQRGDEDDDYDNEDDEVVTGLSERTKAAVSRQRRKQMRGGKDGQGHPKGSSIYFHRFETFGSVREKDWYLTLPDGELVLGSACGAGWAAVVSR